ncbi:unnamed protein product [Staurois parvus]|uniref:TRAF-type domain-containing protein n=1 Tax=Staurois parvus TaxID=386267 RepID=A0ABN9F677_9NEOB|nr:unnamed protein product [Staurois parvus]
MTRNKLAEHLQYCPANVVCCTMEWNRWPVNYADRTSYENLSTDVDKVEQLDLALALQDQRMLLESLKVATMMSKTTEKLERHEPIPGKAENDNKMLSKDVSSDEDSYNAFYQATLETTKSLAAALDILNNATRDIAMLNGRLRDASSEMNKKFQISEQNGRCDIFKDQGFVEECTGASNDVMCSPLKQLHQNGSSDFCQRDCSDLAECEDLNIKQTSVMCNGFHNDEKDVFTVVSRQNAGIPLDGSKKHVNHNGSFLGVEHLSATCIKNGSEEQMDKNGEQWFRNVAVFGRSPFLGNSYWFKARTESKAVDTSDLEVQEDPMGLNRIDLVTAAFSVLFRRVTRR